MAQRDLWEKLRISSINQQPFGLLFLLWASSSAISERARFIPYRPSFILWEISSHLKPRSAGPDQVRRVVNRSGYESVSILARQVRTCPTPAILGTPPAVADVRHLTRICGRWIAQEPVSLCPLPLKIRPSDHDQNAI